MTTSLPNNILNKPTPQRITKTISIAGLWIAVVALSFLRAADIARPAANK